MRKLLLLLLFGPLFALAQQPFGYHATWYFEYNEAGFQGIDSLYHAKDTVYKGDTWQFFERGAAGFTYMFQTKNDSVFYLLNDEKRLMYDFNATAGDAWQFAEWDSTFSCVDTPTATVVAIGYDTINGNALKYWLVKDVMDSIPAYNNQYMCSSGYCVGGKIYEHIGRWFLPTHWFAPITPEIGLCNGVVFKTNSVFTYSLRCYKDDNNYIQFTNKGCTWWSGPGVKEDNLTELILFPNPTTGELNIQTEKEIISIMVYDMLGRSYTYESGTSILLPDSKGVYFVQVIFKGGVTETQKIIRH
jgi:hypothetical protein